MVGLGREAFEQAVIDPDALVDTPEVQYLVGPLGSFGTTTGRSGSLSTTSPWRRMDSARTTTAATHFMKPSKPGRAL
jgi:hypothetical protein